MDLKPIFEPQSMAVFGVSAGNYRHPATEIFTKNLLRYPLRVYGVNPTGGKINGQVIRQTIQDVPEQVDIAVIAVRAEVVAQVMASCIEAGVRSAVIISGGFAEVGQTAIQERIVAMAREADIPFIGPNCLGVFVPNLVDSFFLPSERMVKPLPGNVSLVSQSGGILVDQIIKLTSEGVGLAKAVSIGNKALIGEIELLDYFAADRATGVIAFYIEGFGKNEGREFVLRAKTCSKPIVVLKAGKHPESRKAVSSHTASLAGDYDIFRAALTQGGILEAANDLELVSYCESLSKYVTPIDGRTGIITASGGHGALAFDACLSRGIVVPTLQVDMQEALSRELSPSVRNIASLANPVDLTGSAVDDDFLAAARFICSRMDIDCLLVLLLPYIPGITSDLGAKLSAVAKECGKPLVAYVPHMERYTMLIEGFELNGVPVSPSIDGAVLMVEALRRIRP